MKRDRKIYEVTREEAEGLGAVAETAISEADALASVENSAENEDRVDAKQAK
jgi:hypothetical protein